MPDHFAVLNQPRRPWLDAAVLKDAFHLATTRHHPDIARDGGEKSVALNAAYAVLREPASRLKHLLELEWPESPAVSAAIPVALTDLFGSIARLRQRGFDLVRKESAAHSPLARALLAEQRTAYRREVEPMLTTLAAAETTALGELRRLDDGWDQRDESTRGPLAAAQQHFAYLAKWQAQLREDLFRLGS